MKFRGGRSGEADHYTPLSCLASPRSDPTAGDLRNENLSLLSTYGPNAWLIRNYQLESQAKEVEAEVEVWKEKVVEVNRKRRVFQVSFAVWH